MKTDTDNLLTAAAAAKEAGLSRTSIYAAIARGRLPIVQLPDGPFLIHRRELWAWLARSAERRELARASAVPVVREAAAGAPDHEVGDV